MAMKCAKLLFEIAELRAVMRVSETEEPEKIASIRVMIVNDDTIKQERFQHGFSIFPCR